MARASLAAMMRELIAAPSVSSADPALDVGNRRASELIETWCRQLGFRTSVEAVPGKTDHWNVVATAGVGPGGLILAGHSDTVPCDPARWTHSPFDLDERDGRLYGLGTTDMKSFFTLALEAAARFDLTRLTAPLTIIATADEETGMAGARALPALAGRGAQVVLGEPTGGRPVRAHKGNTAHRIRLTGRSGHSSDPANGNSALEGMHAVLTSLLDLRRALQQRYRHPAFSVPTPTMNFGCIHGGDNPNRICAACELSFDLRILPGMDARALIDDIKAQVLEVAHTRKLGADFDVILDVVPPLMTAEDRPIIEAAQEATGHAADAVPFTTEGPFYQQQGLDVLVLGPGSIACAHQPDEFLDICAIEPSINHLSRLIDRFCVQGDRQAP